MTGDRLGRIPALGDVVEVELEPGPAVDEAFRPGRARLTVVSVRRHVPHTIRIAVQPENGRQP